MVLCYQVAELFDDGVHELLSVSVCLPELCKHVVLPVALPHSMEENERVSFPDFLTWDFINMLLLV